MRKQIKRIGILMLVFCMLLTAGFVTSADEETTETPDETVVAVETAETEATADNSYESYISEYAESTPTGETVKTDLNAEISGNSKTFTVDIPQEGVYQFGLSYLVTEESIENIVFGLKIDGVYPFAESEKLTLSAIYRNADGGNRVDGLGNEFAPKQVLVEDYYFDTVKDITKWCADEYGYYLTAGTHRVELIGVTGTFKVESATFHSKTAAEKYAKPTDSSKYYTGKDIVIEGENATKKTGYWLGAKTDNSSADVTPHDAYKSLVNYIGGGNWQMAGQTLTWETPDLKEGYYRLGFSYRQNAVVGAKVYRSLKIDGETPFREAESVGFTYSYEWEQTFFSDKKNDPYLIYLPAGKHEISLTVVPGEIDGVRDDLKAAVSKLGDLYVDITMITGESVDVYRDYDLFSQIPDMEERLKEISKLLGRSKADLQEITGEKSGSYISVVNNMEQIVNLMLQNRYTAHRYKSEYYSKYTSLASVLYEMSDMPLDLDKLVLSQPASDKPVKKAGFFEKLLFLIKKFFASFVMDYNNISGNTSAENSITIWVNWGRDQAQVLNSLIQTDFAVKQPDISVNVQLVNASVVQAVLSGKGPDCLIQHSRSEPVNLAMRGMLYDLKKFDDCDEVLKNFHEGAELPYYYKGGLYGLPDTQSFYLMFYRKDIFEKMDLAFPDETWTWDNFEEAVKLLARNNLTAWMPNNTATSVAQANIGVGSINMFPSLLLQSGLSLYSDDGKSTNLTDSDVVSAFNEWTDMYTNLKLPRTMDFYNRFRTGTCPLGISTYTLYTTLKAAAPEIDGLWDVALVPGTAREDGTVDHTTSGGGTACSIMSTSENPEAAWEFLKWWVSSETQLAYSSEVESILGPTGRVSVSNVEAFRQMQWDSKMKDVIVTAMDEVREIPEYPGSYYVSRSIYQSFWNVVENNQNPKDMLLKYAEEANEEISRKWRQYENR